MLRLTWQRFLWLAPIFLSGSGCSTVLPVLVPAHQQSHEVDFQEALEFAHRAEAVYLEDDEIRVRYPGRRLVTGEVAGSEVRYLVVFDDRAGRQDLAIRGTSNLENVKVDVEFSPDPDERLGLYLHSGFARASQEMYGEITAHLRPDYATTVTGHSLGGAIAVILGLYLQADGYEVTAVRTFGQPKLTNVTGARGVEDLPLVRFVNGTDPVPDLPPILSTDPQWAYTHLGAEVILWGQDRFIFLEAHQVLWTGSVSFWSNLGDHEIVEHKMASYVESLGGFQGEVTEIRLEDREASRPVPGGGR